MDHGRYVTFQIAAATSRNLFAGILRLIVELHPPPSQPPQARPRAVND
jgi:hypothetical protein